MGERPHQVTVLFSTAALVVSLVSVGVSYQACRLTRDNTQIAQRAYLTARNPRVTNNTVEKGGPWKREGTAVVSESARTGETYRFELDISNLGNTPAVSVSILEGAFSSSGNQLFHLYSEDAIDLAPQDTHVLIHEALVRDADLAPNTAPVLVFRGWAIFMDMFEQQHTTDWCFVEEDRNDFRACDPKRFVFPDSRSREQPPQRSH